MILLNQLGILFNLFTRYIFRHKMLNFQWSKMRSQLSCVNLNETQERNVQNIAVMLLTTHNVHKVSIVMVKKQNKN